MGSQHDRGSDDVVILCARSVDEHIISYYECLV